jgi:hypothetical protein
MKSRHRIAGLVLGVMVASFAEARAQEHKATSATAKPKTSAPTQPVGPYKDFKGVIKLDVRDSTADWGPFSPKKAPAGAPDILFVLYDDTGGRSGGALAGLEALHES